MVTALRASSAASAILVAGCASAPSANAVPPTSTPPVQENAVQHATPAAELPGVVVEDAGAEPRRTLNFLPQPGWQGMAVGSYKFRIVNDYDGGELLAGKGNINMASEMIVKDVTADQVNVQCRMMAPPTVTELEGDPQWTKDFMQNLGVVQSAWRRDAINRRNEDVLNPYLRISNQAAPNKPTPDDGMEFTNGPFLPRTPVGVGARWTYTMRESGASYRLEIHLTQLTAESASLTYSSLKEGAGTSQDMLVGQRSSGEGQVRLSVDGTCRWERGLPIWATLTEKGTGASGYKIDATNGQHFAGKIRSEYQTSMTLRPATKP
jgi:hypothetical protein